MLMNTHNGAVDKHVFKISVTRHFREDPMPDALSRPACKALVDAIPETKLRGKIAPRTARACHPEHGLNKQAIVCGGSTRIAALTRRQRFDPLELIISQPKTCHPDAYPKVRI
jgi:hypothetical protein